jgi:hypothetical protein
MRKTICSVVLVVCFGCAHVAAALPIAEIGFMSTGGIPLSGFSANAIQFINSSQQTTYSIDVIISILPQGLQAGQIVSAYDLDVLYDPTLLVNTAVTFGPWLGNSVTTLEQPYLGVSQKSIVTGLDGSPGVGVVNFLAGSILSDIELQSLQSTLIDNGSQYVTLATLDFIAVAPGSAQLIFDWSNARGTRDVKGMSFRQDGYEYAGIILSDPLAVPEPGTLLLTVAGILALMALRLRADARKRFTM